MTTPLRRRSSSSELLELDESLRSFWRLRPADLPPAEPAADAAKAAPGNATAGDLASVAAPGLAGGRRSCAVDGLGSIAVLSCKPGGMLGAAALGIARGRCSSVAGGLGSAVSASIVFMLMPAPRPGSRYPDGPMAVRDGGTGGIGTARAGPLSS